MRRLGDDQRLAATRLDDDLGHGTNPDKLAKIMKIGPQRALDILERLVELGVARHNGSKSFCRGSMFDEADVY